MTDAFSAERLLLQSGDHTARWDTLNGLRERPAVALQLLDELFATLGLRLDGGTKDGVLRVAAAELLAMLAVSHPTVGERLLELLGNADPVIREKAAHAIGLMKADGAEHSVALLHRLQIEKDPTARFRLLEALKRVGKLTPEIALVYLADSDERVRELFEVETHD